MNTKYTVAMKRNDTSGQISRVHNSKSVSLPYGFYYCHLGSIHKQSAVNSSV